MRTMQSVVAQTVKANPPNRDIFLRVPLREIVSPALTDRFRSNARGSGVLLETTSGAALRFGLPITEVGPRRGF